MKAAQQQEPIKETVSENTPKPKRGRPWSEARHYADHLDKMGCSNADTKTQRSRIDAAHRQVFFNAYNAASAEVQIRIMGFLPAALLAGTARLPRGYPTAATEIGRWINEAPKYEEAEATTAALEIVADARDNGVSWSKIRAHFRTIRLGERRGNANSLQKHLSHALKGYVRRYPATFHSAQVLGIQHLLENVERGNVETN